MEQTVMVKDPTAPSRKKDHIELAFESQVRNMELDRRFNYEPMLSAHPGAIRPVEFLGKTLRAPIWVSSMTGGTKMARTINAHLARACSEFGMGMGLGSCRSLLESDDYLADFDVRPILGPDLPLYANLGIAQIETLIKEKKTAQVAALLTKLQADGLFIHVNPLQEWLQPEGDKIERPPIDTISEFLGLHPDLKVIVKEVGQGMGPESLRALLKLPLAAIEFAAHGGTNFSKLELKRGGSRAGEQYREIAFIGHSAPEMVALVNDIIDSSKEKDLRCQSFILSGGVENFLDGYYLRNTLKATSVYGQASALLKHAAVSYEDLRAFLNFQVKGYALAEAYLRLRK